MKIYFILFASFLILNAKSLSPYANPYIDENAKIKIDYIVGVNLGGCQGCHGSSFEKSAFGKSMIVSQMSKKDVGDALVGYKNNTYGRDMKHVMFRQVSKYDDIALRNTGLGK